MKPKQKAKKKTGRPMVTIDWKIVDSLLEADCEGTEIAGYLGINEHTLYQRCLKDNKLRFSDYLREKKAKGNSLLKAKLYESAVKDKNTSMQIWLSKQRLGYRDKQEITGKDGTPLINLDPFKMIRENSGITKK